MSNGAVSELAWGSLGSPVGEISVACTAAGLARVCFGPPAGRGRARARPGAANGQPGRPDKADQADGPPDPAPAPSAPAGDHLDSALAQVAEYFDGQRRTFDVPVDWSGMSATQRQVLPVLLAWAGYGETVTYGALARRSGLADGGTVPAARVAGQVMGSNPCPIIVPCHRVVTGDGLGGYSGGSGIEIKRWLLTFEGALPPTLDWDPAGPGAG